MGHRWIQPGSTIDVYNAETGRKAEIYDPIASRSESVGSTLLWRIVRVGEVDYPVGFQLEAPTEQAAQREILDDGPTALDLAKWYQGLPERSEDRR